MTSASRSQEISEGLRTVRSLIAEACVEVGRDPSGVTLVVVTKTFPVSDIRLLADLGVRDVGENRHQEAVEKATELADLDLVWHFVGQVQSNKAGGIASYADVVHSLDSSRAVHRLARAARELRRCVTALVQVSLDPPGRSRGRGGVTPAEVPRLAAEIAGADGLRLGGVMGVAPRETPAADAFGRLAAVSGRIQRDHPTATIISAGMSGDFPPAVRAGATHVRVGSAVLGARPLLG